MKIAVYGATGYTGRMLVAELFRRNVDTRLLGRDEKALSAIEGARDIRVVSLDDPSSLVDALRGCDVVISLVSPFTEVGAPVVEAAIAAGCNYVDTSGEQRWIKQVYEEFGERAAAAGVTLVPACADSALPSDLIAGLVAKRLAEVETLRVNHAFFGTGLSRGSMLSFRYIAGSPPIDWKDGKWQETDGSPREPANFPGDGEQPSWGLPGPETPGLQRHVAARNIDATMNMDLVASVAFITDEVIANAPSGPTEEERRAGRWTLIAEARAPDGTTARGYVTGSDPYGTTAFVAAEAAVRLGKGSAPAGVMPPSLAFEPAEFLDALKPLGVSWQVED